MEAIHSTKIIANHLKDYGVSLHRRPELSFIQGINFKSQIYRVKKNAYKQSIVHFPVHKYTANVKQQMSSDELFLRHILLSNQA
jgi:hypothetical protein